MDARRILVPLDGSEMAEVALRVAESLSRGADTTFVLVRAAEAPSVAERYLETVAADLRARRFENVEIVPSHGPASAAILEAVRTYEPDVIVMATSSRRGVRRFSRASVAETVVRGTHTPVFLVRTGDAARRSAHRHGVAPERERVRV
jgi:nucleotide-binding universal stress UspA family protein